jgi:hypothetical protein
MERHHLRTFVMVAAVGQLVLWQPAPSRCDLSLVYAQSRQDDPVIRAVTAAALQAWEER